MILHGSTLAPEDPRYLALWHTSAFEDWTQAAEAFAREYPAVPAYIDWDAIKGLKGLTFRMRGPWKGLGRTYAVVGGPYDWAVHLVQDFDRLRRLNAEARVAPARPSKPRDAAEGAYDLDGVLSRARVRAAMVDLRTRALPHAKRGDSHAEHAVVVIDNLIAALGLPPVVPHGLLDDPTRDETMPKSKRCPFCSRGEDDDDA